MASENDNNKSTFMKCDNKDYLSMYGHAVWVGI